MASDPVRLLGMGASGLKEGIVSSVPTGSAKVWRRVQGNILDGESKRY